MSCSTRRSASASGCAASPDRPEREPLRCGGRDPGRGPPRGWARRQKPFLDVRIAASHARRNSSGACASNSRCAMARRPARAAIGRSSKETSMASKNQRVACHKCGGAAELLRGRHGRGVPTV